MNITFWRFEPPVRVYDSDVKIRFTDPIFRGLDGAATGFSTSRGPVRRVQKEWGDSLEVEMVAGPLRRIRYTRAAPTQPGTPEAKSVTAGHVTSGTPDGRRERFGRPV